MASSSENSPDLFASKGRAMPAGSEPLAKQQAQGPEQGASPKPDRAEDKPQDDGPASILSIDLRRSLVPAPTASPGIAAPPRDEAMAASSASTGTMAAPPPQGQGVAGPFIAALVAISIAGGVFYVFEKDRTSVTPVAEETSADSTANASSDDTTLSQPPEQKSDTPQAAPASESEEETVPEDGRVPSFDLVRVEPDGSAVIAGRAAPHAELLLLHNGEPIGKVKADWAGEWAFVTDKPLQTDRHKITILVNDPDAEITLPEGAEPPAKVSGVENTRPR
jgi:hypothetical protein